MYFTGHYILQLEQAHRPGSSQHQLTELQEVSSQVLQLGPPLFKLAGLAIGNGLTDPKLQVSTLQQLSMPLLASTFAMLSTADASTKCSAGPLPVLMPVTAASRHMNAVIVYASNSHCFLTPHASCACKCLYVNCYRSGAAGSWYVLLSTTSSANSITLFGAVVCKCDVCRC